MRIVEELVEIWLNEVCDKKVFSRSFQGLSVAIETVRIAKELIDIWPNEVCDTPIVPN